MTVQADYSSDMSALVAFFDDLETQLTAIQAKLSAQGIQSIPELDALVTRAATVKTNVDNLGAGTAPASGSGTATSSGASGTAKGS